MNWTRIIPATVVGVAASYLLVLMVPPAAEPGQLPLEQVASVNVVEGGRIKPLDTVARTSLMIISKRQTFTDTKGHSHTKGHCYPWSNRHGNVYRRRASGTRYANCYADTHNDEAKSGQQAGQCG